MLELTRDFIRTQVADSAAVYQRGVNLYQNGAFMPAVAEPENGRFVYRIDGNYGDYLTRIQLSDTGLETDCNCPYPGMGCKHSVAALLDARDIIEQWRQAVTSTEKRQMVDDDELLTSDEIRSQALEDRRKRARHETFRLTLGDTFKGEHLVENEAGRQYMVTLHDPANGVGHCTCPDYLTNRLGTCKHLVHVAEALKRKRGFRKRAERERFPFVDIYWDSAADQVRRFSELPDAEIDDGIPSELARLFGDDGRFSGGRLADLLPLFDRVRGNKRIRIQESVFRRLEDELAENQLVELSASGLPPLGELNATLYPYQEDGVRFGLFRRAALIGDEMGLGKTIQAIALGLLKKELFGFEKVLVVTLASLKEQWKREIERFTGEKALVVAGTPTRREAMYMGDDALFKITNYEAVLRDVTLLRRYRPDLIILDEAQRIKNFATKTADAVKRIPRKHALVLTGTPLENKLEDVYSIVQFLDPRLLSPLWQFAADHFMLSRKKKGKILGYRNLEMLHGKLKSLVIRRRKEEVLSELPDEVVNNYYIALSEPQAKIHAGCAQLLMPLLNKKFITPMDFRRIMELLQRMRMVCDSTYLIDRKTHISPKLQELEGILDELVKENGRKVVIFSEWTSMTFLIARHLSDAGIPFVELTGKIPVNKRQSLIDEFTHNPECKVFLSTDAGGTGLNLQAADCVINFELPWNPAKMNQRIGRVNRIGQKSRCVNVINLISKLSIEEKILTGLQLKTDLFQGVFDGGQDVVEFSQAKRNELLNRLREMMGEEPEPLTVEAREQEEIPDDTPHYLNPKVLNTDGESVDFAAEEQEGTFAASGDNATGSTGGDPEAAESPTGREPATGAGDPEKMETVLNSGMAFLGGLLEMATGQKLSTTADDGRMVNIDRTTGEVTLKFKLPGF